MNVYNWFKCIHSIDWPKSPSHFGLAVTDADWCNHIPELILVYKGIYIIHKSCNTAFGNLFLPTFKIEIMGALIFSFVAIVRMYEDLHLVSLLFVGTVVSTACLIIAPTSIVLSSLYDLSCKFGENLLSKIHLVAEKKSKRTFERQLKSCLLIRCQVGNFYYMEAKAKLTLLNNVLNGIVCLLVNIK